MALIRESIEIPVTPDEIWGLIGDPGRVGEWVPALSGSSATTDGRACTTAEGAEILERVLEHSDEERFYTYAVVASPFPLRSYVSSLSVQPHGRGSRVDWTADFEPDEPEQEDGLRTAFSQVYRGGLDALRERFEAPVAPAEAGARG